MGDFIGHSESHDRAQLQGHIHLVPGHGHLQKYLANGPSENHNVDAVFGGGGVVAKPCPTLATSWTVAHRLLCPWDFPSKSTGVGCHLLLQN